MKLFPMFLSLEGKNGLLVGGGQVALRKAEKLEPFGIRLTVIAPEILPELSKLSTVTPIRKKFEETDLNLAPSLVIAATGDLEVNHHVAVLCRQRGILVNAVDQPELCTFQFPALVNRGQLTIGISTGGASPTAAASLRRQIDQLLPEHFGELLDKMVSLRAELKGTVPDAGLRMTLLRKAWEDMTEGKEPSQMEQLPSDPAL